MAGTDNFRRQHEEIIGLAGNIMSLLNSKLAEQNGKEIRGVLSSLAGKINVHLAMEDNSLYPRLLEHENSSIRLTAKQFNDEMGQIKDSFLQYNKKWSSPTSIDKNRAEFTKETKGIFTALTNRINKENDQLYKLLDSLG